MIYKTKSTLRLSTNGAFLCSTGAPNYIVMKKLMIIIPALALTIISVTSCKKKESGVCYCDYASGDKKEFNLSSMERSQQIDSCYQLDLNAGPFGGECELE